MVEGVPYIFSERYLGLTSPAGYGSQTPRVGTLVIDDSAEVGVEAIDRDQGIGTGLDFTFKLLDDDTIRSYMARPSLYASLTADLAAGDLTAHVADTTGWPAFGLLYAGLECIAYAGKTGTTFTGLTRGQYDTLESTHKTATVAQIVTDTPRFWRGRGVTLWATLVDPSGAAPVADLLDTSTVQLWRGRITEQPTRHPDGFSFACQSIDLALSEPLSAKVSGAVLDAAPTYLLPTGWTFGASIIGRDALDVAQWTASAFVTPFAGMASTYASSAEIRDLISTAWTAAITASGASTYLGELLWTKSKTGTWDAVITVLQDPAIYSLAGSLTVEAGSWSFTVPTFPAGMQADVKMDLNWDGSLPPFCPTDPTGKVLPTGVTLRLDSGTSADVPPAGKVKIASGSASCTYSYSATGTDGGDVHLHGLVPLPGNTSLTLAQVLPSAAATAEVVFADTGAFSSCALRTLESSGTALRGFYDLLPQGQGYALPSTVVDSVSFTARLGSGSVGDLSASLTGAGASFVDLFGGVLSLTRLAVVAKPSTDAYSVIKLACVETAQGTDYVTVITDADLLSHEGDPVVSIKRADAPNVIDIVRKQSGSDTEDHIIFNDNPQVEAVGKRDVVYRIDAEDRAQLQAYASKVVSAHYAYDQTLQAVELLCHPAVEVEVGDAVWLTTTHPSIWTWGSNPGAVGYDGPGRVTGKKRNLKTCAVTLVLLIDGALVMHALSPAALVTAWGGAAGAPTWIEVDDGYYLHFAKAILDAAAPVPVLHYQPGQVEGVAQAYTVSAAAVVGAACRLTVATQTGVFDLDTALQSTLTLPLTASATTYQNKFAHADDGSQWA